MGAKVQITQTEDIKIIADVKVLQFLSDMDPPRVIRKTPFVSRKQRLYVAA